MGQSDGLEGAPVSYVVGLKWSGLLMLLDLQKVLLSVCVCVCDAGYTPWMSFSIFKLDP